MELEQVIEIFKDHIDIEYFGEDVDKRAIIGILVHQIPINTNNEEITKYIVMRMEKYVIKDYILVYINTKMIKKNPLSTNFLRKFHENLNRDFKKNLKKVFIVSPPFFMKVFIGLIRSFISDKFIQKIQYIYSLEELREKLLIDEKTKIGINIILDKYDILTGKLQFGADLIYINKNNACVDYIPPIVRQCIEHLSSNEDYFKVQGLFRHSGQKTKINLIKQRVNKGETVCFKTEEIDVTTIACLLKQYFRELPEPIFTNECYTTTTNFLSWTENERLSKLKILLNENIPKENKALLNYLLKYLNLVITYESDNRMNSANLSIVFAPNLIWTTDLSQETTETAKKSIIGINSFFEFLIVNYEELFFDDILENEGFL